MFFSYVPTPAKPKVELKVDTRSLLYIMSYKTGAHCSSGDAVYIAQHLDAAALATPQALVTKMARYECTVEPGVAATVGTQCLIHMFDPTDGWDRDSQKRPDMLRMTAELVDKGVKLEGLSFDGKSVLEITQELISDRPYRDPPAKLNSDIIAKFTKKGYKFEYPELDYDDEEDDEEDYDTYAGYGGLGM